MKWEFVFIIISVVMLDIMWSRVILVGIFSWDFVWLGVGSFVLSWFLIFGCEIIESGNLYL